MSTPTGRIRCGPVAISMVAVALGACAGDDSRVEGTVPNVSGTIPAGGPAVDLSPVDETTGRDVVMIGDSITVASTPALEAAATELGVDLRIYAEVGRRITVGSTPEAGIDVLQDVLGGSPPDLFVVALGTNDVGKYETQDEYEAVINALLELVPDDAPVAWINAYLRDDPDDSALFNAALLEALRARGNATIARWSNVATKDGILSDGIHPTDEGMIEFTELVSDQMSDWLE